MTTPEYADDVDRTLFNAVNRLQRLAEMTGDDALRKAARTVAAQRPQVRAHMTQAMRQSAPN